MNQAHQWNLFLMEKISFGVPSLKFIVTTTATVVLWVPVMVLVRTNN